MKKQSPQKARRNVYTWKEHREVKIESKSRITGNLKNQTTYKLRSWKKRKDRKHLK